MVISGRKFIKDEAKARARDLTATIAALSPLARDLMTTTLIASEWYSTAAADEVMRASAAALGVDPLQFARDLGYTAAYETAGAIGRTFANIFLTPPRLARHIDTARAQIYDSGETSARYDGARLFVDVTRWRGHTDLGCLNMLGLLHRYGALCRGATLVDAMQPKCTSRGDALCAFELAFTSA